MLSHPISAFIGAVVQLWSGTESRDGHQSQYQHRCFCLLGGGYLLKFAQVESPSQQIENFELDRSTLDALEDLLVDAKVFTDEFLEEYLLTYELETLFADNSEYNKIYLSNLERGRALLEAVRNKKEARRPPLISE
jgi:hypothetical protein